MGTITILPETTKNPITLMGQRAGVCWNANVSDNEKNYKRGLDCIKSGHGRVMEYVNVEMIIDGYSAKVLREFYTHIGGAPTRLQASTRYINYSKGDGFTYTTPHTIEKDSTLYEEWVQLMANINQSIEYFIANGIPVEDATMLLPLAYSSKMVDRRNLRNFVDMSRQRMCSRAYWEYRELFRDICNALREYSDEWKWIVDNLFHAKCDEVGYCTEAKSCGRQPIWVKGKPDKSGHYMVRYQGRQGRDDYTTSDCGHWWNTGSINDQENVEFIPESFREL